MYGYLKYLLIIGIISNSFAQSGLSVHGYLNQAFAFTDGNQIFGIPEKGTSDYRNLALQFRYDVNEYSNFVIQLSHKRVGLNPLMTIEEDIRLDWGYFEYHFNDNFSAKIGKIQMPFGNYNEFRDVGVLLPFYSVPYSPYGEGNYMSETVDGFLFSYESEVLPNWIFDFDVYGGHWIWQEWFALNFPGSGLTYSTGIININNGLGGQLRIETPIEQIELKIGGQYAEPLGGITFSEDGLLGSETKLYDFFISAKAEFQYFVISSEVLNIEFVDIVANPLAFNGQLGIHILNDLDVNFQYEDFKIYNFPIPNNLIDQLKIKSKNINYNNDYAIGLKYFFTSHLVLKSEFHWNKGYLIENKSLNGIFDEPENTRYAIFSIATSF